jgi:aspartyl/asparaginyl-tRNA synthetase
MEKITSWVSKEDGTVVEGDVRCYPKSDGTYEIEATKEYAGFDLGLDRVTKVYTVIYKIDNTPM